MAQNARVDSSGSPNDHTIHTYELAAARYAANTPDVLGPELAAFIARFVALLPAGSAVLEIGSGTGRDALVLEQAGLRVRRTDAASSFVTMLRAAGYSADVLNVLRDDLGGPYDGIYTNAVLLHLSRPELQATLIRTHASTRVGGVLAFTVKAGEGEGWSSAKVGHPRHFVYWTAGSLRRAVEQSPWRLIELVEVPGGSDDWLYGLCRRAAADEERVFS